HAKAGAGDGRGCDTGECVVPNNEETKMNNAKITSTMAGSLLLSAWLTQSLPAQVAPPEDTLPVIEEEVVILEPFEVTAAEAHDYAATTTMAGTRINTMLKDVGSAISVVTKEFLEDTGAVNNETLLQYTTN